jgi:hypothetical protein
VLLLLLLIVLLLIVLTLAVATLVGAALVVVTSFGCQTIPANRGKNPLGGGVLVVATSLDRIRPILAPRGVVVVVATTSLGRSRPIPAYRGKNLLGEGKWNLSARCQKIASQGRGVLLNRNQRKNLEARRRNRPLTGSRR